MASMPVAQVLTLCQFCEESSEIQWKCIKCDLLLCQLCNSRLHRNEKFSGHDVINLRNRETTDIKESIRKMDLKNMPCVAHPGKECVIFCLECDEPVCPKCLTQSHLSHKFEELEETYKKIVSQLNVFEDRVETEIKSYYIKEKHLQNILSYGEQHFKETRKDILTQEETIKEAATKQAKKLLQDTEMHWHASEDLLKTEIGQIETNKKDMESIKTTLEQAMHSHQAVDIFKSIKSLNRLLLTDKIETKIILKETKHVPSKKANYSRSILFGNFYQIPNFEKVQSFQTSISVVGKIVNVEENSAFVGSFRDNKLFKFSFEKDKLTILSDEDNLFDIDMTMTHDGKSVFLNRGSEIRKYCNDQQQQKVHSFAPLFTLGLCTTERNEILVGLSEVPKFKPSSKDSIRRVVVLSKFGYIKHIYQHDQHNQQLFTWPWRITTTKNNICVIDILNDTDEGRVVVVDRGGQLQGTYNGCDINSKRKFYPKDVACTSNDLILISDRNNHAIHVLNAVGDLITCKEVKSIGIEGPFSLNVDKSSSLWVGCNTYKNNKSKGAMIYKVKLI